VYKQTNKTNEKVTFAASRLKSRNKNLSELIVHCVIWVMIIINIQLKNHEIQQKNTINDSSISSLGDGEGDECLLCLIND
jgi:hypothetical protein